VSTWFLFAALISLVCYPSRFSRDKRILLYGRLFWQIQSFLCTAVLGLFQMKWWSYT
jgi:hypothetical protein